MNEDFKILNQLKNKTTYKLPEGYFDHLAANILLKTKSQSATFTTPNNYFESLADNILAKVKTQVNIDVYNELQQIAPLLNTISKHNTYKVPENYFETLRFTKSYAKPAKIILLSKVYKYVAAAMVIGIVGLVYFVNSSNKTNSNFALQHNLSLKINVPQEISSLQDGILNNAVENEKAVITTDETVQNATLPFWGNIQEELEHLSDEEINSYLSNNNVTTEKETTDINS